MAAMPARMLLLPPRTVWPAMRSFSISVRPAGSAYAIDELGDDARAVLPGHPDALPGAGLRPLLEEPATLSPGGRECDEPAARYRQHRPHGAVEILGHATGFIGDEQGDR